MAGYHAYIIGVDDRTSKRVVIICDDDEEAELVAKPMVDGHALDYGKKPARSRCSNRLRVRPPQLAASF